MTQDIESKRSLYQQVNHIGRELISIDPNNITTQLTTSIERINAAWHTITVEILSHSRDYNELVKCAEKYNGVKEPLEAWLDEVELRIVQLKDIALDSDVIEEQISEQKVFKLLHFVSIHNHFYSSRHFVDTAALHTRF